MAAMTGAVADSGAVIPNPNSSFGMARSMTGRIPVVALTANAMSGDQQLCLDAGMDAYVTKPAKVDQLLDAIDKFVGVHDLVV